MEPYLRHLGMLRMPLRSQKLSSLAACRTTWPPEERSINTRFLLDKYAENREPVPPSVAAWIRDWLPELASHAAVHSAVAASEALTRDTLLNPDILMRIVSFLPVKEYGLQWILDSKGESVQEVILPPLVISLWPLADALMICRAWMEVVVPEGIRASRILYRTKIERIKECSDYYSRCVAMKQYMLAKRGAPPPDSLVVKGSRALVMNFGRWLVGEEDLRAKAAQTLIQRLKEEEEVANGHDNTLLAQRVLWRQQELQKLLLAERRFEECKVGENLRRKRYYDSHLGGFRIGDRVILEGSVSITDQIQVPEGTTGTVYRFGDPYAFTFGAGPLHQLHLDDPVEGDRSQYYVGVLWDANVAPWSKYTDDDLFLSDYEAVLETVKNGPFASDAAASSASAWTSRMGSVASKDLPLLRVIDVGWREMERRGMHLVGQGLDLDVLKCDLYLPEHMDEQVEELAQNHGWNLETGERLW